MNHKLVFLLTNVVLAALAVLGIATSLNFVVNSLSRDIWFWAFVVVGLLLENEFYQWVKKTKRSGTADLLFILFMFLFVYLITDQLFTGLLGCLAVYMLIGAGELKEHDVINKVVMITAITYTVMFVAAVGDYLIAKFGLPSLGLLNKAFALSLWLLLILGFAFFGRRYIIVWRFMSPQYISLGLYLLAWVLVATVGFLFKINIFTTWIYIVLIGTDCIVYVFTGTLIDKFLGVKPISTLDEESATRISGIVQRVSQELGLKGKVKVGFGKYPIINAMAYGASFDKRICIIAPNTDFPPDELEAIVAHELAHLRFNHPLKLLVINAGDLVFRWIFQIPATIYDFAFGKKFIILGYNVGILGFLIFSVADFAVLYIFVRVMEGNADLAVKRLGKGPSLAKALYTLESFYALGQQVGLNVVLLANEQLDENHFLLNYVEAARTLHEQLYRPPRSSAVSTLLSSHPPTFLRIANMLLPEDQGYTAWQETILPARFLRRRGSIAFSSRVAGILAKVGEITRHRLAEAFPSRASGDLTPVFQPLHLNGNKCWLEGRYVVATNRLDRHVAFLRITGTAYHDSVVLPYTYTAEDANGTLVEDLDPAAWEMVVVGIGETYLVKRHGAGKLVAVQPGKTEKKVTCQLKDGQNRTFEVPFKAIKNQVTAEFLSGLRGKPVFVDHKDAIDVLQCVSVEAAPKISGMVLEARDKQSGDSTALGIKAHSVRWHASLVAIHSDDKYIARYLEFFRWCTSSQVWVRVFLKKPVNNEFYCKLTSVSENPSSIAITDVFGTSMSITFKELDFVVFEHDSIELVNHGEESATLKLGKAIMSRRHSRPWVPTW
jgi:Zn-dependent protease with chaperone function